MDKLPQQYEFKWENRWVVKLPKAFDLREWVTTTTTLPSISFIGNNKYEWEEIKISFVDPIGPSTSQRLWDLFIASDDNDNEKIPVSGEIVDLVKNGFDFKIKLLAPDGAVVSEWDLFGCQITKIDFGKLDMSKASLIKPSLTVKPTHVKLLY